MNPKLENAKNLYLEGIRDGNAREAVTKYTGDKYIQHSTGVKDGVEGFIEFFEPFIKRNPKRDIQIIRSLVDGQYVFLHVFQSLNDGEYEWVTTDFFDTDHNDKIIEHWDVISEYSNNTPYGNTSIDGMTEITDLNKTEENKKLIRSFIADCFMQGGDSENISKYISKDNFVEHSVNSLASLEKPQKLSNPAKRYFNYNRIVLMVGQGNFVATLSEANWHDEKSTQDYALVDIFRIENGKVVEHWDNIEAVPENDVNSGKF